MSLCDSAKLNSKNLLPYLGWQVLSYRVKDLKLAPRGLLQIEWAKAHMPVLRILENQFAEEKPLEGVRIAACLHVTKETGYLMRVLKAGGAKIALAASNPLSTQDEVAARLVEEGIEVYAWRGETSEEYYWAIRQILRIKPHITMDDGADLTVEANKRQIEGIIGGTEETTTGVNRIKALEESGMLRYPVIAVNNAKTKFLFDNRYGTGQSTLDGIMRATNVLIAGKTVVVAGYGWVGRGVAMRAKGLGARVIVVEPDPIRALEAYMDGYEVTDMIEAAKKGDIFITATGNINVIRAEHFEQMKDGAILANTGHFDVEISVKDLKKMAVNSYEIRPNLKAYVMKDGRKLYLLAEGRLVNLAAAEGHPSEVMDMSFSLQALSVRYLVERGKDLKARLYVVPDHIDKLVAKLKLQALGIKLEELTEEQRKYMASWELGT